MPPVTATPPPTRSPPRGSPRFALREKEGLALINGTDGMLGMLLLALHDLEMLLTTGRRLGGDLDRVAVGDGCRVRGRPDGAPPAGSARRHPRRTFASFLAGSPIVASHRGPECTRVQDAYSLRCAPRCTAPRATRWPHAAQVAERELASRRRQPVVTVDGRVESNGNFHGAPSRTCSTSSRSRSPTSPRCRSAAPTARSTSRGAPAAALPRRRGWGRIGPDDRAVRPRGNRVGAQATRRPRLGRLDPLERHAGGPRLDGVGGCRKLRRSIDGLARVFAIEVLTGCRALDLRAPSSPRRPRRRARDLVRTRVEGPGPDRFVSPEIEAVTDLVASGAVARGRARADGRRHTPSLPYTPPTSRPIEGDPP